MASVAAAAAGRAAAERSHVNKGFAECYFGFLDQLKHYLDCQPPVAPEIVIDRIHELNEDLQSIFPSPVSHDPREAMRTILQTEVGASETAARIHGKPARNHKPRKTVIPFHTRSNWANEVKTAALCSTEGVIAEEPLIHRLAEFEAFQAAKPLAWDRRHPEELLPELRSIVDSVSRLLAFVEEGILEFRPFISPTQELRDILDQEAQQYLQSHMELGETSGGYPSCVKVKVPRIAFDGWVEYDWNDMYAELGISFRAQMIQRMTPHITGGVEAVYTGLQTAAACNGTFWTGSPYYWNLAGAPSSDRPAVRSHSFVQSILQPHLEAIEASELIKVRKNESSFLDFASLIDEIGNEMTAGPSTAEFSQEVVDQFRIRFEEDLLLIQKSYSDNSIFREAGTHLSKIGIRALTSRDIFAAMGSELTTVSTYQLANPIVPVTGAMVLWQLGKRS
jgi:hypothetical protein